MRVLHAPLNIAGQPYIISRAERRRGIISDVLIYKQNDYRYECDINLDVTRETIKHKLFFYIKWMIKCIRNYDIFHFHYGKSFLPYNLDLPLLRLFGKKIVMHYWGSDVIQKDIALKKKLVTFTNKEFDKIFPTLTNSKKQRKKLQFIKKYAHAIIVGDYSLGNYTTGYVIRQAIDLEHFPFIGAIPERKVIKIIHAPTNEGIKGTKDIELTIQKLKKDGYPIEYQRVQNVPHREAIQIYKNADIIIDDINQGPYGILAIEAMALGKPVICRIIPSLTKHYENLPIINADKYTLEKNLIELINDFELRKQIGLSGRNYVEENHDSNIIASEIYEIYKKICHII